MGIEKLAENIYQPLKIVGEPKKYELKVVYKSENNLDSSYQLPEGKLRVIKNDNLTTITNGKTFFCD